MSAPDAQETDVGAAGASTIASPAGGDPAVRLLADLKRSGGVLRIPDPAPAERALLRRALHAAKTSDLVPEGHHLQYTGRDKGDLVIRLLAGDYPLHRTPRPDPVPVRADLPPGELHPLARDAPLPVCPDCQARARRILHALCCAAQHKGFTISSAASEPDASLVITAHDSAFPLHFTEGAVEVLDPDSVRYSWQRVTARTTRPSHQLDLCLEHAWAHQGRRHRWGDRQRWRLEDKLPQILSEIEHRARADEERRLAQQRQEEETRRRWQQAMDRARDAVIDAHRLKALRDQVEAWNEACRIRAYCDALEHHLHQTPADNLEEIQAVVEWITWARDRADRIDPVPRHPRTPENPQIGPEDLRPYLGGWSPYGPKRS